MKFYKYDSISDIPSEALVAGNEFKIREGSADNYIWRQYKVAADGKIYPVRGTTAEEDGRLSQMDNAFINKVKIDTYTKSEVDNKDSEINYRIDGLELGVSDMITTTQTLAQLNTLPDGNYEAQTSGVYANGLTAKEGYYTKFKKEGTVWSLLSEVKMPEVDKSDLVTRQEFSKIKPIEKIIIYSNQLLDNSEFKFGRWDKTGVITDTVNSLRSGKVYLDSSKSNITFSGGAAISPNAGRFVFFDGSDNFISYSDSLTAAIPSNASYVGVTIVNSTLLGPDPTNTAYKSTAMLNYGSVALPFEEYSVKIDSQYISEITMDKMPSVFDVETFNLINPDKIDFVRRYSVAGNFVTDTVGIAASDWIPVKEGEWYAFSGEGKYGVTSGSGQGGYFTSYGANNSISTIDFVKPVNEFGSAFKVPTGLGITHVVLSLRKLNDQASATTLHGNVQLELGEMATDYKPYSEEYKIKPELLPNSGGGESGGTGFDNESWYKYVNADGGKIFQDKLPKFRKHNLLKDKDIVVVNTGTSLTARTSEHCTLRADGPSRPPMMHANAFCSFVWDALKWEGQHYRRYDYSGFFTEVGNFLTSSSLVNWDDGAYRDGLTRYSDDASSSVSFAIPVNAWQFNWIYRTDSVGADAQISIAEGTGKVQVFNEVTNAWVEAHGFIFSMKEATPVDRVVNVPSNETTNTVAVTLHSKGNTTYQKRLKMRCRNSSGLNSLAETKSVTISKSGTDGRFMYWGVEWSHREFMITYINSARGSHNTSATGATGLPRFQDNEIWGFKPDLILSELGIHNDGAAAAGIYPVGRFAGLTRNYITNTNYELSMFSRSAFFGLDPEYAFFTASIAWNFGGINDDGTLKSSIQTTSVQGQAKSMTALDKYQEATNFLRENYPDIVSIDAAKRWVDAGIAIFGNMRLATVGSGKDGRTFTNEGSHWNDSGSKVMAKCVIPLL